MESVPVRSPYHMPQAAVVRAAGVEVNFLVGHYSFVNQNQCITSCESGEHGPIKSLTR